MPRILLVEDDKSNAVALSTGLRKSGYQVDVVDDGKYVDEMLSRNRYDLVITDYQMPEETGTSVIRRTRGGEARATPKDVPIVALTAGGSTDHLTSALELGANKAYHKPYVLSRLIREIGQLLKNPAGDPDSWIEDITP